MRITKVLLSALIIYFCQLNIIYAQSNTSLVPARSDANLYQINIRTFSKEGNLRGIIPRIDSIKNLGINVVYLMPIYPIGKVNSVNSPYCISDFTSVNEEFGSLEDLKVVVDSIHSRKMAVILDWVPNHTSYDHKWIKDKSWYLQDSTGNIVSPPGMGWNDVAQLNFKNMDMRAEMIAAMKYWLTAANVDGFRCDYADGPTFDFWKQAVAELRKTDRKLLLLAEGKRTDHYKAGFDYTFGFKFFEHLKEIYKDNRSVKSIDSLNITDHEGATDGQDIVRYVTNHDVNGSDGTPQELFGGQKGSMAAFVVISYMNSIPMIYNGQEVGTPFRLVFPFTTKKIEWNLNPEVTAEYKKVIALRNRSAALRKGKLESYSSDDVCAFVKTMDAEKVFVLSNLRNDVETFAVPKSLRGSKWKNAFTGISFKIGKEVKLEPYSYLVLEN